MKAKYNGYSFELRDTVARTKVQFNNRYGIALAGDLYLPKSYQGKLAAVAVAGPFGAVKEQAAGLYAEELASRGFAALAFDPSFIGESGGDGYPHQSNSRFHHVRHDKSQRKGLL